VEIKNTFHELTAVNLTDGSIQTFKAEECRFGYRDSIFKREAKNKFAIVKVSFQLDKNARLNTIYGAIEEELKKMNVENPTIRDVSNAVIHIRQSKLPDPKVIGNAGSFFKNPEIPVEQFNTLKNKFTEIVGYPSHTKMKLAAGWLIEQCGWKGKRIGETGMHAKQALVLVNYGKAKGNELYEHAQRVQESVEEKFGVRLEMEVNVL
jgi:UDP-N-acetylmuramate dehydrogenase